MIGLKQRLTHTHAAGYSLLEVLVGLIILAIGLLGLAGMQMVSLRQNNDAYLRSQATLHAYDILDRMRANRSHALDGRYEIEYGKTPLATLPTAVKEDLVAWKGNLAALPGPGDGEIEMTDGTIVIVRVKWQESRDEDADWQEFTTQSEL